MLNLCGLDYFSYKYNPTNKPKIVCSTIDEIDYIDTTGKDKHKNNSWNELSTDEIDIIDNPISDAKLIIFVITEKSQINSDINGWLHKYYNECGDKAHNNFIIVKTNSSSNYGILTKKFKKELCKSFNVNKIFDVDLKNKQGLNELLEHIRYKIRKTNIT